MVCFDRMAGWTGIHLGHAGPPTVTLWIYNPPEPTGQPTAPGPDMSAAYLQSGIDGVTQGRCAGCAACPKVWRMEIPFVVGEPFAETYAGVVYLQRLPYGDDTFPDINFDDYFSERCSYLQALAPPFRDANRNLGPFGSGWTLSYDLGSSEGSGWSLYSPAEEGGGLNEPTARSRWVARERWHCLEANVFQLWDNIGAYPFPYIPEFLTITPHPA